MQIFVQKRKVISLIYINFDIKSQAEHAFFVSCVRFFKKADYLGFRLFLLLLILYQITMVGLWFCKVIGNSYSPVPTIRPQQIARVK